MGVTGQPCVSSDMHEYVVNITYKPTRYTWARKQHSHASPVREFTSKATLDRKRQCTSQSSSDLTTRIFVCSWRYAHVNSSNLCRSLSTRRPDRRTHERAALLTLSAAALVLPSLLPPPSPRAEHRLRGQDPLGPSPYNECCSWAQLEALVVASRQELGS